MSFTSTLVRSFLPFFSFFLFLFPDVPTSTIPNLVAYEQSNGLFARINEVVVFRRRGGEGEIAKNRFTMRRRNAHDRPPLTRFKKEAQEARGRDEG